VRAPTDQGGASTPARSPGSLPSAAAWLADDDDFLATFSQIARTRETRSQVFTCTCCTVLRGFKDIQMLRQPQAQIAVQYGTDRRAAAFATHPGMRTSRAGRSLAATIRDLALIALAWAIFIGLVMYPAVQIIGIATCAVALLIGSGRRAANRTAAAI
jgi:hypothetical protein